MNLAGAAVAAMFVRASLVFYLETHRLLGELFVIEQTWFVLASLICRPPRRSPPGPQLACGLGRDNWRAAAPPGRAQPPWGVRAGFGLQSAGLVIAITTLGRWAGRSGSCR